MDTHRTRRNDDILAGFAEKTEKYSVSVSFFFGLTPPPRPKPTDFLVRNRKTDRAIFYFRFTTLTIHYTNTMVMVGLPYGITDDKASCFFLCRLGA